MNKAWHLRQDGKAFPVKVHMYCMEDDDLSSEAEVASFLISSDSKDQDIAEYVLDAWMALLIEEEVSYDTDEKGLLELLRDTLSHLPYKFQYPLSVDELIDIHTRLGNYKDIDTLYEFTDKVRDELESIQEDIKNSINQQFCRVRFGGQYNTVSGNNEIWFRVSSAGFNWVNTIYLFTSSLKNSLRISHITICRDSESDGGFSSKEDYFYRAKDGAVYYHMPIEEYLEEEHEHNPVFESNMNAGVIASLRRLLGKGFTYNEARSNLIESSIYRKNMYKHLIKAERKSDYVKMTNEKGLDIPSRII